MKYNKVPALIFLSSIYHPPVLALVPPSPAVSISVTTASNRRSVNTNTNTQTTTNTADYYSHRLDQLCAKLNSFNRHAIILQGGSSTSNDHSAPKRSTNDPTRSLIPKLKKVIIPVFISALVAILVLKRNDIAAFNLREELATRLDTLASLGTPGIVIYTVAFMLWELTVGVTTPVETAAGMAFGLKNGIMANAIGKTSGAVLAFLIGRYVLKGFVQKTLEGNELMELVQDSIAKNPIRVALIWRFSFLPEQIKNFGLAVLPVKTWQFISAVLMHGFPFTLLWTFLGNEMGLIVRGVMDSPSRILKILLAGVYVFGFIISPTMVGLWVKGLRDEKMKKEHGNKQK